MIGKLVPLLAAMALATPVPAQERVPGSAAEMRLSFAPVARAAMPAVVNIYARRVVQDRASPFAGDPFFDQFFQGYSRPRVQNSLGSGVIVDPSGIVVSNHHVVGTSSDIRVVLADRREFAAELLLSDAERDIAVMRIRADGPLPALDFARSAGAEVGDLVLAIGNPFGVGQTVTSGIVSGLARSARPEEGMESWYIQTDAAINPGNSGGALVDMDGRLLGINTSILTRSGGSNGIGFAIPADLVRAYVARAVTGATEMRWPWAGLRGQEVDQSMASALGLSRPMGVLVSEVHPEGVFGAAGVRPGDLVLSVDGVEVAKPGDLEFHLLTHAEGETVEARLLRDGREETAILTVAPAPERPARDPRRLAGHGPLSGCVVETVNPAVIAELDLPLDARGVLLRELSRRSYQLGLRPGDVITEVGGTPVRDTAGLAALADALARGADVVLQREGRTRVLRFRG